MELAGKRAGVRPERVAEWERGEANPTVSQLRALAAAYKRPLALFYLPEPPRTFTKMHDYRRLPDTFAQATQSPELLFEIHRAWNRRDISLEVMEDLQEAPPEFRAPPMPEDPEAAAAAVRESLGVTPDAQANGETNTMRGRDAAKLWNVRELWLPPRSTATTSPPPSSCRAPTSWQSRSSARTLRIRRRGMRRRLHGTGAIRAYLGGRLGSEGPMTAKGRTRALLSAYLNVVDRQVRIAQLLGLASQERQRAV